MHVLLSQHKSNNYSNWSVCSKPRQCRTSRLHGTSVV